MHKCIVLTIVIFRSAVASCTHSQHSAATLRTIIYLQLNLHIIAPVTVCDNFPLLFPTADLQQNAPRHYTIRVHPLFLPIYVAAVAVIAMCISYGSGGCDWNAFQHIFRLCELSLALKAQWSLYVLPVVTIYTASGHCIYRQLSLYIPPVVTIYTASGHYMYRQWSLYIPPVVTMFTASGQYMYCQWSLYVQPV